MSPSHIADAAGAYSSPMAETGLPVLLAIIAASFLLVATMAWVSSAVAMLQRRLARRRRWWRGYNTYRDISSR